MGEDRRVEMLRLKIAQQKQLTQHGLEHAQEALGPVVHLLAIEVHRQNAALLEELERILGEEGDHP